MSLFPWACSSTADIWDAGLTFMCDTGLMATAEKENFSPFHGTSVAESSLDRKQNSLDTAEKGKLEPSLPLGRTLSRSSAAAGNSFHSKKLHGRNSIQHDEHETCENRSVLAKGWIYRKDTEQDGSVSSSISTQWQRCWAELTLPFAPTYEIDSPTMHIYSSQDASLPPFMSINLASTVIVASNKRLKVNTSEEYASFDIVQIQSSKTLVAIHKKISRQSFSVPIKERNDWMTAINSALVTYENAKLEQSENDKVSKSLSKKDRRPLVQRTFQPNVPQQEKHPDLFSMRTVKCSGAGTKMGTC